MAAGWRRWPKGSSMNETITKDELPTSFGSFNPVGHVMVGLPEAGQVDALKDALRGAGWQSDALVTFTPGEAIAKFAAMTENQSDAAGFGYEITLQLRYLRLAREGYGWLLVKVDNADDALRVADTARAHGATQAVHYRMLVVQELI
jgi:hypothetical protein